MFALSPDIVKPGCHLRDLMQHRKATGSFVGDVDSYCQKFLDPKGDEAQDTVISIPDGRLIHLIYKRSPDGGWATTLEDVTEGRRAQAKIEYLAHYDALTNLPNRVLLRERLAEALADVPRGEHLAVLYLDLDHFKSVNDTLGHHVGDELLKVLAKRLQTSVRDTDTVARVGGDEFAIIQCGVRRPGETAFLARRICDAVCAPYHLTGHAVSIDTSIGIAVAPNDGNDPDELLKSSDMALYGAKADGRGTYRFFEPAMDARMKARRGLELALRRALANGEFELHYQPLLSCTTIG
jgi:diguanylate cyclase (GGDEF)-like protein